MIYQTLLLIGVIGLAAQALLGFAHVGGTHDGGHAGTGHDAGCGQGVHVAVPGTHLHGHVDNSVHGHAHVHLHANGSSVTHEIFTFLLPMMSPVAIFSLLIGAGAVGMLAQALKEKPGIVIALAILGGLLFYGVIVRPLWSLMFKFASKPAETLSGAVAAEAVAASRFDAQGRGVVRLTVDGQTTRVLAYLEPQDREKAASVALGDSLIVTSVDARKNTCRVTCL